MSIYIYIYVFKFLNGVQNKSQLQGITPEVNHVVPSQQNVYFVGDSHCVPPAWQAIQIKVDIEIFQLRFSLQLETHSQSCMHLLAGVGVQ